MFLQGVAYCCYFSGQRSHEHNFSVRVHIQQTRQQTTWIKPFPSVSGLYAKLGKLGAGCSFTLTFSCHSQQESEYFPKFQTICSRLCHISRKKVPRFYSKHVQYVISLQRFVILLWLLSTTYSIQHDSHCLFCFRRHASECRLIVADRVIKSDFASDLLILHDIQCTYCNSEHFLSVHINYMPLLSTVFCAVISGLAVLFC